MECVMKRQRWAPGSYAILFVAFALAGAGCGDSVSNCGNGLIEGTEECDGSNLGEETCVTQGSVGGSLGCQADCTFDTSLCTGGPVCGDNTAEGTEVCDGTDLAGENCVSQGFTGGTLGCLADCTGFDTSGCTGGPVCGDNIAEGTEVCDGTDLAGENCVSQGFTGGTLACTDNCTFDTSGCTSGPVCGDGVAEAPEDCDGTDLADEDCVSQGFTGGTLACTANCTFDTSGCTSGPVCGDNVAEAPEVCDGSDLGDATGLTCAYFEFTGGTLACNATCDNVDLTACAGGPPGWTCPVWWYGDAECDCGCGVIDLLDCADGTVASCDYCGEPGSCSPLFSDCPGDIDPTQNSLCLGGTAVCGDGVAEPPEQCDGVDLQGLDCTDSGFTGGTLGCMANCTFDTSGCTGGPVCGDNVINQATEVCDGTDLGPFTGATCEDAGFTGGTLACNATCDNVDLTACAGGPPGWTCPVWWYGDAECDCGCGVIDLLDCADGTVASCDYCGEPGSCSPLFSDCPGDIDPTQNSLCLGGTAVCGDGVAEPPEQCDGVDLQGLDCTDSGFTGGTLGCMANCTFDTSGCTGGPVCGDDTVQWPELCDGTDLGFWTGATCVDFYFVGGTLVCNATCDNLNLTACTGGPPGWTCNVLYYDAFDGCDCGCGVIDPDCIDDAVASCEWCDDEGSCSPIFSGCPGDIDPDQNWLCGTGGTGGAGGMPGTGGSGGA